MGIDSQVYDLSSLAPEVRHFWTRGFADRITIDGLGIRVEYTKGKPQVLRWDNPELEFYTVDFRQPVARRDRWATPSQASRTPFTFTPGPWGGASLASYVWISEAAYTAVQAAGFAARLHVYGGYPGRSYPFDAQITVFKRKPNRFWPSKELNPDAEWQ
jgi:hypothetical protein